MTGLIVFIVTVAAVSVSAYAWSVHSESKYIDEWYERGPWYATLDRTGRPIATTGTHNSRSVKYDMNGQTSIGLAKMDAAKRNHQHYIDTQNRARSEALNGRPL